MKTSLLLYEACSGSATGRESVLRPYGSIYSKFPDGVAGRVSGVLASGFASWSWNFERCNGRRDRRRPGLAATTGVVPSRSRTRDRRFTNELQAWKTGVAERCSSTRRHRRERRGGPRRPRAPRSAHALLIRYGATIRGTAQTGAARPQRQSFLAGWLRSPRFFGGYFRYLSISRAPAALGSSGASSRKRCRCFLARSGFDVFV